MSTIAGVGQIALALLVVAIVIGLSTTILEKIKTTTPDDSSSVNETLTWGGNNTAIGLNQERASGFILYNNATPVNRGSGANANYTTTSNTITIINTSAGPGGPGGPAGHNDSDWITSDLNLSYSYLFGSNSRNITVFGVDSQLELAGFLPTVAIIAIASVLLGILFFMFGRKKEQ